MRPSLLHLHSIDLIRWPRDVLRPEGSDPSAQKGYEIVAAVAKHSLPPAVGPNTRDKLDGRKRPKYDDTPPSSAEHRGQAAKRCPRPTARA